MEYRRRVRRLSGMARSQEVVVKASTAVLKRPDIGFQAAKRRARWAGNRLLTDQRPRRSFPPLKSQERRMP